MYGPFIRAAREAAGLSQVQLAAIVGTSQPTLSAYEHGRRMPTADTLNRLISGCGFILQASAGERRITCPFPDPDWLAFAEPTSAATEHPRGQHGSALERARRLDAVLELGDALRESKAFPP